MILMNRSLVLWFFVLVGLAEANVDHSPKWLSINELTYGLNYYLPDVVDGNGQAIIPHAAGSYGYCRWGNLMHRPTFTTSGYYLTRLTSQPFEYDLFLSRNEEKLEHVPFPSGTLWPTVSWPPAERTALATIPAIDPPLNLTYGSLFRYLYFSSYPLLEVSTEVPYVDPYATSLSIFQYNWLPESADKLVILVHGWNPDSNNNGFFNWKDNWNGNFAVLTRALQNALKGSKWHLVHYNWAWDSDTGEADHNSAVNGTEAAEIGTQHGWHLAKLLQSDYTGLRKVHLIAHSAGSWVAWSSAFYIARYLPEVTVQITLLDPFMPNSIWVVDSALGTSTFESYVQRAGGDYTKLFQVENYWADDLALGTNTPNFNFRFDISGYEDVNFRTDPGLVFDYDEHGGPIRFYADTVINSYSASGSGYFGRLADIAGFDPDMQGWKRSMAFIEKRFGDIGFSNAIIYATGVGYDPGYGWLFLDPESDWVYSYEHGDQFVAGDFESGAFIYDLGLHAYIYTESQYYPLFYSYREGFSGWCWYVPGGTPEQRWFYNIPLGVWMNGEGQPL